MDFRFMGFDSPLLHALHLVLDPSTEASNKKAPRTTYVRDAEAMAAIPADVIERLNSYVFLIDMPGLRSGDIRVQVEDDNVLEISGDRKQEDERGIQVFAEGEEDRKTREEIRAARKCEYRQDHGGVPGRDAERDGGEIGAPATEEA